MPVSNQSGQPDDRLQRELDEILEKARIQPVSFQQRVEQKRNAVRQHQRRSTLGLGGLKDRAVLLIMKVPILTGMVLAAIAAYLAPELGIIAALLALSAVVMVFVPFAARRPASAISDETRWRGRVVSSLPPASDNRPRSWVDDIKRRFNR